MSLAILNVGAGDTKLSFDPKHPAERIRAARIVRDMLRRGYALLVQVGVEEGEPVYQRARGFDETKCEYIIADLDPEAAEPTRFLKTDTERSLEQSGTAASDEATERAEAKPPRQRGRPRGAARRLPAATTPAVAVSRSAGG